MDGGIANKLDNIWMGYGPIFSMRANENTTIISDFSGVRYFSGGNQTSFWWKCCYRRNYVQIGINEVTGLTVDSGGARG